MRLRGFGGLEVSVKALGNRCCVCNFLSSRLPFRVFENDEHMSCRRYQGGAIVVVLLLLRRRPPPPPPPP